MIYLSLKAQKLTGAADLSSLTVLETVVTGQNQELKSLNLSRNVSLKSINSDFSGLEFVRLDDLKDLETFSAIKAKLTELDISQNPKLRILQLGSNRTLNKLDVTNNPAMSRFFFFVFRGKSMTDQMPKPTGLSNPSVGNDDFFNQDFSKFGQPEKNLEVGGGDLAVGLAGSAARGVGTGIAEIGLSDLLRAGAAISDKLPGSQIADVVSRKINGWTEEEQAFARACQVGMGLPEKGMATQVLPVLGEITAGSKGCADRCNKIHGTGLRPVRGVANLARRGSQTVVDSRE